MSKRDESIIQFVQQYSELGYLPEAVVNFIALLGWSPGGEVEMFTLEELVEQFDLDRVSKSPAVFDMDKLNWMNNHYIKQAPLERIAGLAVPHLQKAGLIPAELSEDQQRWATELVGLYQEQLRYAAEIVDLAELFFREKLAFDDEAAALLAEEHVPAVVQSFLKQVESADSLAPENVQKLLKAVQAETGYKGKQLFMSIRVALTGQMHGRDLNMTIHLLGREKVQERLRALL